jgi:hypothetical protein
VFFVSRRLTCALLFQENAGKSPTAKKAEQKAARAAKAEAGGTVRK